MHIGGLLFAVLIFGMGAYVSLVGFRRIDIWKQYDQDKKDELYAQHGQKMKLIGILLLLVGTGGLVRYAVDLL